MADYIDRKELLKKAYVFDTQSNVQWVSVKDIKSMPSVDAVEVVRCKDCKQLKAEIYLTGEAPRLMCGITRKYISENDFCSSGATMDEEEICVTE